MVERGTAVRARALKRPIARQDRHHRTTSPTRWFIGFEPSLAAGVWVGYDDKRRASGRGEEGGRVPRCRSGWTSGRAAMKDKPIEDYPIPGNIVFVPVDEMGRPGRAGAPGVQMEAFVAGTEPRMASGPTASP